VQLVTNARQFVTVVLVLLSQLAGGMAVMCDEGLGGQILEIFPQFCCETEVGADPSATAETEAAGAERELGQVPCGPCLDIPLVSFIPNDDDLLSSVQSPLVFVTTLPDTPLTQLTSCGCTARDRTLPAASSTTVAQLMGTVVLLC
jgi:hypothetical protein